jgi:hypothetical protein
MGAFLGETRRRHVHAPSQRTAAALLVSAGKSQTSDTVPVASLQRVQATGGGKSVTCRRLDAGRLVTFVTAGRTLGLLGSAPSLHIDCAPPAFVLDTVRPSDPRYPTTFTLAIG